MVGCSQSLALAATAMAVSTTAIIVAFSRHRWSSDPLPPPPPPKQQQQQQPPLRSCLSTPESKKKRPKKKVKFAVKLLHEEEPAGELAKLVNTDDKVEKERSSGIERIVCTKNCCCRTVMMPLPPNRIPLYSGILKDRSNQRQTLVGCSH